MQRDIVSYAFDLLETARLPRTTVQTPFVWDEDTSWKERYGRVDAESSERLRRAGEARRVKQEQAKGTGQARST